MKTLCIGIALLLLSVCALSQTTTTPPSVFDATTFSFGLTPLTLPSLGRTLSGMETDTMIHFTPNNIFGATTLISSSPFIGGRYERVIPSVGTYLENHTALTGANFQAYLTGSLGVVKAANNYWGERVGAGLKWAPAGSSSFDVAIDIEANNLPGIGHWIPSVAISPQFRF